MISKFFLAKKQIAPLSFFCFVKHLFSFQREKHFDTLTKTLGEGEGPFLQMPMFSERGGQLFCKVGEGLWVPEAIQRSQSGGKNRSGGRGQCSVTCDASYGTP